MFYTLKCLHIAHHLSCMPSFCSSIFYMYFLMSISHFLLSAITFPFPLSLALPLPYVLPSALPFLSLPLSFSPLTLFLSPLILFTSCRPWYMDLIRYQPLEVVLLIDVSNFVTNEANVQSLRDAATAVLKSLPSQDRVSPLPCPLITLLRGLGMRLSPS